MLDADLVRASRRGDKRAFVEIVARHQAMVCGITLGILGDFAASEDAAQEAFLAVWRELHELREPGRLRAWLGQIARKVALGHLRRKRDHDPLREDLPVADDAPLPDEAAATAEEAALVRASLANLPETYRLPLVLYYREGQSVRAVAETLGLTEDAVKQRLARGRGMLRDRMSSLVETVLVRTQPTALFTMAVVAAIGALTAPAAVAGSVFTATSAAGTPATASSTSTVLTAMSTSKAILVAAALAALVCVPVGYQLHTGTASPVVTNAVPEIPPQSATAATNAAPTFEDSALFVEWRALHERYGTNAAAMPLLYKAIASLQDQFRRRAFHAALAAEWAQVDPASGFKFYSGKGTDATLRQQFFEEWLARDPGAAVEALTAGGKGWENVARECLSEIARRAPAAVPDIASRVPKVTGSWDKTVQDAFAILAVGGVDPALKAAQAVTGPNRDQALAGVAQVWAKTDLNQTIAWAKTLPDGTDRTVIISAALVGKAALDPAAALDQLGAVPNGGHPAEDTTGARVLAEAAKADFDATVAWVAAHPGRLGREDLNGLREAVSERLNADPAGFLAVHAADGSLTALLPAVANALFDCGSGQRSGVWDWLKTQPDNETTKELKADVLGSTAYQKPERALQWVADLPRTPEGEAQVTRLAQSLLNGGSQLYRFDTLLPQVPERLRQPLIDAAFDCLGADSLGDPRGWISRLSLLTDASRPKGTKLLARAWAAQSPEEAAAWASSLASGDGRNGALGAVASAWAAKDAPAAADWVAALPPGADRDQSAQSLVMAAADQYPREAWAWALSISDTAQRSQAAAQAVKAIAARDPATARQWIQTGPFTDATRSELEAALQENHR